MRAEPDAMQAIRLSSARITRRYWPRFGDLAAEQLFHRQRVGQVVAVRVQVVHAVGHHDALVILLVFGFLLHAGVQVADDALALHDDLAIELADDPEDAVGARGAAAPC